MVGQDTSAPAAPEVEQGSEHPRGRNLVITREPAGDDAGPALPLSPALREQQSQALRRQISTYLRGQLHVTVTDNRAVMISVQRDPRHRVYRVRLHHLFVGATDPVIRALARYVALNDRRASREIGKFIEQRQDRIRAQALPSRPQPLIRTVGTTHDLQAYFAELNAAYFGGKVSCQLTWGRQVGRAKPRRSIKIGSYSFEENLIRIHPGLDQRWIPPTYVKWILYHEMLHALHPAPLVKGRHQFHSPTFTAAERQFVEYAAAREWERRNLAALLGL